MNEILTMKFKNPVFFSGVNLTVRRGTKWDVGEGVEFQIPIPWSDDPMETRKAKTVRTQAMVFQSLVDMDLSLEHESEGRTYRGLCSRMIECYPNFDDREVVTLVFFTIERRGG